jgi:hypothetical protein
MPAKPVSASPLSGKAGILVRAVAIFGGVDRLSVYLGFPADDVRRWMAGDREPPYSAFLLAVDALLDEEPERHARRV